MVVLVALVAMLIGVIALSRSMDTNQLVAGNLAFRNATVHSSDAGIQGAVQWLQTTVGTPTLNNCNPNRGYFANIVEPNWDDPVLWAPVSSAARAPTLRATPCSGWCTACALRPGIRTIPESPAPC